MKFDIEDEVEEGYGHVLEVYERELERLQEVERLHVALLGTLAPSRSIWIRKVWKNARAAYDRLGERQ